MQAARGSGLVSHLCTSSQNVALMEPNSADKYFHSGILHLTMCCTNKHRINQGSDNEGSSLGGMRRFVPSSFPRHTFRHPQAGANQEENLLDHLPFPLLIVLMLSSRHNLSQGLREAGHRSGKPITYKTVLSAPAKTPLGGCSSNRGLLRGAMLPQGQPVPSIGWIPLGR